MKNVEIGLANKKRIDEVDQLKGFSIFTIVLMHFIQMIPGVPPSLARLSTIGGTGVHVFFLCSGIGLYLSYLNKKNSFFEFMKKRFLKIYIPYIIVVIVSFFIPWMYEGEDRVAALLSHIFLYKMFIPGYDASFGGQFWFISTIFQFYLVFIPMCRIKEKLKKNSYFIALFMAVSVLWWFYCWSAQVTEIRVFSSCFLQYIWEFSIGMAIADSLYQGKAYSIKPLFLAATALVGTGLQAMMAMKSETLKVFNDIPALIGYTSLALLLMMMPMIKTVTKRISTISYELFLTHILVISSILHFFTFEGLAAQGLCLAVSITIAVSVAYVYHILIGRIYRITNRYAVDTGES